MTWTWTLSPPGRPAESGIVTSVPVTSTAAGIHVSPSALHSTVNVISSSAPGSGSSTSQCTVCVRCRPDRLDLDGADRRRGRADRLAVDDDPVDEQVERYGSFDPRNRREEPERPGGVGSVAVAVAGTVVDDRDDGQRRAVGGGELQRQPGWGVGDLVAVERQGEARRGDRAQLVAHHRLGQRARPAVDVHRPAGDDPALRVDGDVEQESLVSDLQCLHAHRVRGHLGDELTGRRCRVVHVGSRLLGDAQVELQLAGSSSGSQSTTWNGSAGGSPSTPGLQGTPVASSSWQ